MKRVLLALVLCGLLISPVFAAQQSSLAHGSPLERALHPDRKLRHSPTVGGIGGKFIIFDVPGSGCNPVCTLPFAINPAGAVTGIYTGVNVYGAVWHGFLRAPNGVLAKFDVQHECQNVTQCTWPIGITPGGVIAGTYQDKFGNGHGFLRDPNGSITTIDPPGSVGSQISGINTEGAVVGTYYTNPGGVAHLFTRGVKGAITTLDVPFFASFLVINPSGIVAGSYADAAGAYHGFQRLPDGTITSFDPAGSTFTVVQGINPAGTIVGYYNAPGFNIYGFVRVSKGTIFTLGAGSTNVWFPAAINPAGTITGGLNADGFVENSRGDLVLFDPPGSTDTAPLAINPAGMITGIFYDANNQGHGFIRLPGHP